MSSSRRRWIVLLVAQRHRLRKRTSASSFDPPTHTVGLRGNDPLHATAAAFEVDAAIPDSHTQRPAMAPRRPIPRRLGHDGRRHPRAAERLLLRRRRRRRLENRQRRRDMGTDVERPRIRTGRRHRDRTVRSENALRRHGPSRAALRHRRRRRHIQIDRRRRALAARRFSRRRATSARS